MTLNEVYVLCVACCVCCVLCVVCSVCCVLCAVCACVRACVHACACVCTCTCVCVCVRTCVRACVRACVHAQPNKIFDQKKFFWPKFFFQQNPPKIFLTKKKFFLPKNYWTKKKKLSKKTKKTSTVQKHWSHRNINRDGERHSLRALKHRPRRLDWPEGPASNMITVMIRIRGRQIMTLRASIIKSVYIFWKLEISPSHAYLGSGKSYSYKCV